MASIIDAVQEAINDDMSMLKYFVFAIPVFFSIYLYNSGNYSGFWIIASMTFILLFGFLIECTANVRNGKNHILPSFNIFIMFWAGIKGIIAIGPSIAINIWLAAFICSRFTIADPNVDGVIKGLVYAVFITLILTSYLLYANNFKIADAYNLKVITDASVDVLIAILFFIPQLIIANAIITGSITYVFWLILGIPNPICTFFWCMVLIFNLAIIANYLAQVDYEVMGVKENQDKI